MHREHTGKAEGRARIGHTHENWAGGVITCDNLFVEREHANRHEGSELVAPGPSFWGGRVDRR
jgi:hypothetical protein